MSGNVNGGVYALTVLTPVREGQLDALRTALADLAAGGESPFARVYGTHVARLTVVPALDDHRLEPEPGLGSYLLFSTDFDGDRDVHLERLRGGLGEHADAIWGHCAGYPGCDRPAAFREYFVAHQVDTGFSVVPYRGSVEDVRDSMALRERLVEFAVSARGMDASTLRARWLETFADRMGTA